MDIVEPINTTLSTYTTDLMLSSFATTLTSNSAVALKLYNNNVSVQPSTLLSALTETNFGGYAPILIASWNGPYVDVNLQAYILSALAIFTCNGTSSDNVYGAYLVADNGGTRATATATVASSTVSAITIGTAGTGYTIPPVATFSGGGGTGAAATFTLSGGGIGG